MNDVNNINMSNINSASSPPGGTKGGLLGSDCSSQREPSTSPTSPPPPKKRLVARIKPVTSPRTSMKLLALQHLANVYATKQAAAVKEANGKLATTNKNILREEDEQHSNVSSPPPSTSDIPLSPMTLPMNMNMHMNMPMNMKANNAPQLEDALSLPMPVPVTLKSRSSVHENMNKKAAQLEEALELPFDPQGGAEVRTFVENGTGGTYQLFP